MGMKSNLKNKLYHGRNTTPDQLNVLAFIYKTSAMISVLAETLVSTWALSFSTEVVLAAFSQAIETLSNLKYKGSAVHKLLSVFIIWFKCCRKVSRDLQAAKVSAL